MACVILERLLDVRGYFSRRKLRETPAPDDVITSAVQSKLVSAAQNLLERPDKRTPERPRQQRLERKAWPADLLDEMHGLHVIQLSPAATQTPLAQPFAQIGGTAHVDKEGIFHAKFVTHVKDARQPIRDAGAMIDIPTVRKHPLAHEETPRRVNSC